MRIPRVICSKDGLEMTIRKTGETVEVFLADGEPYYKISGDTFTCANCGAIVTLLAPHALGSARDTGYGAIYVSRKADLVG